MWTVGRDDKLHPREHFRKRGHDVALPLGVQVQIQFVHQHNSLLVERIFRLGIQFEHPFAQVGQPGERRLVAEAQFLEAHVTVFSGGKDHHHVLIVAVFLESKIRHARKQVAAHQVVHLFQPLSRFLAAALLRIVQLQQPLLEIQQARTGPKECLSWLCLAFTENNPRRITTHTVTIDMQIYRIRPNRSRRTTYPPFYPTRQHSFYHSTWVGR